MAKITTITNPLTGQPAQVDQLDHTAQEIDDAIARALPGGAIDTALQNKAPAGFGLGGNVVMAPSGDDGLSDADLITSSGFYKAVKLLSDDGKGHSWHYIVHETRDNSESFQFASNMNAPYCIKFRNKIKGVWKPWEFLNPPLMLNTEYRTTERYLGKPVYCMTKFVGEVAADTVTQVIFTSSDIGEYCIRAFCTGKRTFNNWEDGETSMVSSPAGSGTIITCDPTIYRLNEGYRSIRAYIKSSSNLKDVYCTAYYTKWAD